MSYFLYIRKIKAVIAYLSALKTYAGIVCHIEGLVSVNLEDGELVTELSHDIPFRIHGYLAHHGCAVREQHSGIGVIAARLHEVLLMEGVRLDEAGVGEVHNDIEFGRLNVESSPSYHIRPVFPIVAQLHPSIFLPAGPFCGVGGVEVEHGAVIYARQLYAELALARRLFLYINVIQHYGVLVSGTDEGEQFCMNLHLARNFGADGLGQSVWKFVVAFSFQT